MTSANGGGQQLCCACKQSLKIGATKCKACGTDQRWWQRALVTAGAVAAVSSLATLAAEQAFGIFSAHGPKFVGAVVAIDDGNVRFSVSNQGDRTGTLMDVMLRVEPRERACSRSIVSFDVRLESENLQRVLEVGKTSSISARPSAAVRLPQTFIPEALSDPQYKEIIEGHQDCKLLLTYVDHNSTVRQSSLPFACIPQICS